MQCVDFNQCVAFFIQTCTNAQNTLAIFRVKTLSFFKKRLTMAFSYD